MKKLIIAFISLLPWAAMAQNESKALSPLLTAYYDIKNALVNSDGEAAASKASAYVKTLKEVNLKSLSDKEQKAFEPLKDKLLFDVEHIAETKDVSHQRDHFSSFSDNMYKLAKATDLSSDDIYQMYCPMKKTYWLSNEKAVKNPYYGKQMLTCGKVTETIK
jgi:hypothetical protein